MFGTILSWLGGGALTKIGQIGVDFYRTKVAAENTTEKYMADLAARELAVEAGEAANNANVVIAEQGNWVTRWVRPAWATPFVFYTWVMVLTAVFMSTPLDPEMIALMKVIAVSYFGGRTIEKVTGIIAQRRKLTGS